MSISGGCSCGNIEFEWDVPECTCVPRACQCEYCLEKGAAYVTEPGSQLTVTVRDSDAHSISQHGAKIAQFHECSSCLQIVFVTVEISGSTYGAINAKALHNREGLEASVRLNFSIQSPQEKVSRWRKNWCHPVLITSQGCKGASRRDVQPAASRQAGRPSLKRYCACV